MFSLISFEKYRKTKSAIDNGIPVYGFSMEEIKNLELMNPYLFYGASLLNSRIFYAYIFISDWLIKSYSNDSQDIFDTMSYYIENNYVSKSMLLIIVVSLISSGITNTFIFFWRVHIVYPNGISESVSNEMKAKIRYAFLYFRGALVNEQYRKIIRFALWAWGVNFCFIFVFIILPESYLELFVRVIHILFIVYVFTYMSLKLLNIIRIDKIVIPKRIVKEVLGYGRFIEVGEGEYIPVREGNPTWLKFYFLDNMIIIIIILYFVILYYNDISAGESLYEYGFSFYNK